MKKRWCLDGPDGIAHYWHQLGSDHQYLSRRHFRGGSVMCWAAISSEGIFDLVWIDGNLNAEEYQKILKGHLAPYMNQDYIFQQDGAPAHTAASTLSLLRKNNIRLLPWPSCSCDLSPIENLWGILTRAVYHGKGPYTSFDALKKAVEKAWYSIPHVTIANLMNGMNLRCLDAAEANYGYIKR